MPKEKRNRRTKGAGSICWIRDSYYLFYTTNGKRRSICLHATTIDDAKKNAEEFLPKSLQTATTKEQVAVHIAEARQLISDAKAIQLSDAWAAFEASPERGDCKEVTLEWHKRIWTRFTTWMADKHPEVKTLKIISASIAAEYATHLWGTGMSGATYNNQFASLRTVLNTLAFQAGLSKDPFKGIERKRPEKKERLGFSLADIAKIMEVFKEEKFYVLNKQEMEVLFNIGIFTGMRLGDCCLLKWESVDFQNNLISVTPIKTSRIQRKVKIPILSDLLTALKTAESWKDETGFVLPKMAKRYGRNVDGIVHDYCDILDHAGFNAVTEGAKRENGKIVEGRGTSRRKYGFHSFRHTFASICAAKGVPITTLSEILGDNVTTLQSYYLHPSEEMRQKVAGALQAPQPVLLSDSASSAKTSDKDKLRAIADYISHTKPTKDMKAILRILQS